MSPLLTADTLDGALLFVSNESYASPVSILGSVSQATPPTGRTVWVCFDGQTSNCQSFEANASICFAFTNGASRKLGRHLPEYTRAGVEQREHGDGHRLPSDGERTGVKFPHGQ